MRFHVCDSTERTRVAMGMVGRGASREAWQWLVAKSVSSRMWYVFPRSGGQSEISRMGSCGRRGHKEKGEAGEGGRKKRRSSFYCLSHRHAFTDACSFFLGTFLPLIIVSAFSHRAPYSNAPLTPESSRNVPQLTRLFCLCVRLYSLFA